MDIFKLGDKILALLEAMFGFWNNQISLVFAMLGQSPVSFKGGGPWAVIEGIEPIFVAVGSSLVVLPSFTGSYADWAQTLIYLCEMTFTIAMTVGSVKGAQTLTSKAFGL